MTYMKRFWLNEISDDLFSITFESEFPNVGDYRGLYTIEMRSPVNPDAAHPLRHTINLSPLSHDDLVELYNKVGELLKRNSNKQVWIDKLPQAEMELEQLTQEERKLLRDTLDHLLPNAWSYTRIKCPKCTRILIAEKYVGRCGVMDIDDDVDVPCYRLHCSLCKVEWVL